MINLKTDNQLRIVLSNTNRALAEAIKQATPEQLELLKEGKDIRGVLDTLAKEASVNSKSNAVLSDILKNSPAFKSLGSVAEELQNLVNALKGDKTLLNLRSKLEAFVKPLNADLGSESLKRQIADSGIFLESKLAASADPKSELKVLLQELDTLLKQSDLKVAASARHHVAPLLEHEIFDPDCTPSPSQLKKLSEAISTILKPLQRTVAQSDIIFGNGVAKVLDRLQAFVTRDSVQNAPAEQPKSMPQNSTDMTKPDAALADRRSRQIVPGTPLSSKDTAPTGPQSPKSALHHEAAVQGQLQPAESTSPSAVTRKSLLEFSWIRNELKNPQHATTEPLRQQLLAKPELFVLDTLKETLSDLHTLILQSSRPESKGLLGMLEKIFGLLNTKNADPLALIQQPQLNKQIQTFVERFQGVLKHADPLLHKEAAPLLREIAHFTEPQRLTPGSGSERFANDLKATLLQTHEQLQHSSAPNAPDIAKQVDKVLLQIDYYQLTSHLSNSTALFFPYSWEMLEEGSLTFKKGKERTFYCRIDLQLKAFGALHLMLSLSNEKQIDLQAYTERESLHTLLKEQMPLLRCALRDAGLQPQKLRFAPIAAKKERDNGYAGDEGELEMGFEVKI